jgi:adenine/guanine phosphoribosyltransferase-like PRPP-binding protein
LQPKSISLRKIFQSYNPQLLHIMKNYQWHVPTSAYLIQLSGKDYQDEISVVSALDTKGNKIGTKAAIEMLFDSFPARKRKDLKVEKISKSFLTMKGTRMLFQTRELRIPKM